MWNHSHETGNLLHTTSHEHWQSKRKWRLFEAKCKEDVTIQDEGERGSADKSGTNNFTSCFFFPVTVLVDTTGKSCITLLSLIMESDNETGLWCQIGSIHPRRHYALLDRMGQSCLVVKWHKQEDMRKTFAHIWNNWLCFYSPDRHCRG